MIRTDTLLTLTLTLWRCCDSSGAINLHTCIQIHATCNMYRYMYVYAPDRPSPRKDFFLQPSIHTQLWLLELQLLFKPSIFSLSCTVHVLIKSQSSTVYTNLDSTSAQAKIPRRSGEGRLTFQAGRMAELHMQRQSGVAIKVST